MRILIAGGAGFVGSHLAARLLQGGHEVLVVDNLITGRTANLRTLESGPCAARFDWRLMDACQVLHVDGPLDAVFHLASPASPVDYLRHPVETLDAGAVATRRLLDVARAKRARFLLASTSEVYGDPLEHPQRESYWGNVNPVGPRSVYDEAKRFAEALASAYGREYTMPVRIARIFNTYGPGMRLDDGRVVPTFIAQALRGEPVTVFGDGSQTRSYCYVDDLVSGLEKLMWSDAEGPVNLGNPDEFTVLETALQVVALTRSTSTVRFEPLPQDDPRVRRPDIGRARELLGWEPRVPFAAGLVRTIEDLRGRIGEEEHAGDPSRSEPSPHANGHGARAAENIRPFPGLYSHREPWLDTRPRSIGNDRGTPL